MTTPMPKLYPLTFTDTVPPSGLADSWYTRDAEKAASVDTREEAALNCHHCEQHGYAFTTENGWHVCTGFKVEERAGKFVVFCEAPLSIKEAAAAKR
jgi:hypothetical protein